MKIKIASVGLALLAVASLPGCATVENNILYSKWQEQAYRAYGMPVPPKSSSPFMSAVMPYRPTLGNPMDAVSASLLNVSRTISAQEQQFVAQYYSLQ